MFKHTILAATLTALAAPAFADQNGAGFQEGVHKLCKEAGETAAAMFDARGAGFPKQELERIVAETADNNFLRVMNQTFINLVYEKDESEWYPSQQSYNRMALTVAAYGFCVDTIKERME